ncbi:hypothetical protein IC615_27395 [Serratia ureilytica]
MVGGGWDRAEIAASARLGVEVTVFERQPALCMRSVGADVSQGVARTASPAGRRCCAAAARSSLEDRDGVAWIVAAKSAIRRPSIWWWWGRVELNLELARSAGLAIESGIVVDGQAHQPSGRSSPGDVARYPTLGLCLQSWAYAQIRPSALPARCSTLRRSV